jgi:hypothetical protein
MGTPMVSQPFPFFKETESNTNCCGCGGNNPSNVSLSEIPQINNLDETLINNRQTRTHYIDDGQMIHKVVRENRVDLLNTPVETGSRQIPASETSIPEQARTSFNMDLINQDKK